MNHSLFKIRQTKGFTMVELIIVIALFSVLFGMGATMLGNFSSTQSLHFTGDRLVQSLREARMNSVTELYDSTWGIYFNSVSNPQQYILFKGNTYATRDASFDQPTLFSKRVGFNSVSLNGGGSEVRFSRRGGFTSNYGTVVLRVDNETYDLSINRLGLTDFTF